MTRLLTVVVLYGMEADESLAVKSLEAYKMQHHLDVIIYNNDNCRTIEHNDFEVVNALDNGGLAAAYNYALAQAKQKGCDWLLLVDQDTELTSRYLERLTAKINQTETLNYVAVVPELTQGKLHHSPAAYKRWRGVAWRCKVVNYSNIDQLSRDYIITAFNSATAVNVHKLCELGGFDVNYPLDMLDHRMCYLYHTKGWKIAMVDSQLEHHLSETEGMKIDRYKNYLQAHGRFARSLGATTLVMFRLRMLLRWGLLFIQRKDKEGRAASLRAAFQSV